MNPVIIDKDSGLELWTATQCAEYSGTARGTFTSYAGRGRAPLPVTKHNGLTLWNSEEIREWHAKRVAQRGATPEASPAAASTIATTEGPISATVVESPGTAAAVSPQ